MESVCKYIGNEDRWNLNRRWNDGGDFGNNNNDGRRRREEREEIVQEVVLWERWNEKNWEGQGVRPKYGRAHEERRRRKF